MLKNKLLLRVKKENKLWTVMIEESKHKNADDWSWSKELPTFIIIITVQFYRHIFMNKMFFIYVSEL